MSAAWPEHGGIYVWVKHAFGKHMAFQAIWFQWVENIVWYPTILSFMAGSIGYLISPSLVSNKIFIVSIILGSFWFMTFINFFSLRSLAILSSVCTIAGLILPITMIIVGVIWLNSDNHLHLNFFAGNLFPNMKSPQEWTAMTSVILSFCGMEIATAHVRHVRNPQRSFPRALSITGVLLLTFLCFGSLMLALIIPRENLSLLTGVMQAFQTLLDTYQLEWLMPLVGLSIIIGTIGCISNWIVAPAKGLCVAAYDGHLSHHFKKENRHGSPSVILFSQAIIVTLIVLIFFMMPSIGGCYWLLAVLATQLYMFMYLLMFAAALYLRHKHPHQHRPFRVPGGNIGMTIISIIGVIGAISTIIAGFIPPFNIDYGGFWKYEIMVILGLLVMGSPPLLLLLRKKYKKNRV